MLSILKITKLDAVRRQLEVAVRLYFNYGDPVSVHTLTAAAYNLLRDLNSDRGGSPLIKDEIDKYIKPDFAAGFRTKLNEAENFFKHADRDANSVLDFRYAQTDVFLPEGCQKYRDLSGEQVDELHLYVTWFALENPTAFIMPPAIESLRSRVREDYRSGGRSRFFAEMLPLLIKTSVSGREGQ